MTERVCEHIVLLGLMGAGKTTVGAALSQRIGWPVEDSDAAIEAETGHTVAEIDDDLGTDAMHRLEAKHLLGQLRRPGPTIICAAASVIDDAGCRAAIRAPGIAAVWLRAELATLEARFMSRHHRPTLAATPRPYSPRRSPFGTLSTVRSTR